MSWPEKEQGRRYTNQNPFMELHRVDGMILRNKEGKEVDVMILRKEEEYWTNLQEIEQSRGLMGGWDPERWKDCPNLIK